MVKCDENFNVEIAYDRGTIEMPILCHLEPGHTGRHEAIMVVNDELEDVKGNILVTWSA